MKTGGWSSPISIQELEEQIKYFSRELVAHRREMYWEYHKGLCWIGLSYTIACGSVVVGYRIGLMPFFLAFPFLTLFILGWVLITIYLVRSRNREWDYIQQTLEMLEKIEEDLSVNPFQSNERLLEIEQQIQDAYELFQSYMKKILGY